MPRRLAGRVGLSIGIHATAALRWVSGDVFDNGRCFAVGTVTADIGGETVSAPLDAHICTPAGKPGAVEQPVLTVDAVLGR